MSPPPVETRIRTTVVRLGVLACAVAVAVTAVVGSTGTPALADVTGRGTAGQKLTVSKAASISRTGETVTVSGSGYDVDKGIYVAFCVDNGAGAIPSPCGGGADTSGSSGASNWISSNPPSYGEGLAVPYGAGGTFRLQMKITRMIGDVDCTTRRCAVVTRTDHTRASDRSQDVRVPVSFAAANAPAPTAARTTAPGSASTSGGAAATGGAAAPTAAVPVPGAAVATGPVATGVAASAVADAGQVTRTSSAAEAGRGWTTALVLLGFAVVGLAGWALGRRRNRSEA
ncbi:hypothetical protein ACWDV4_19760 [Micromonospora sp. NPDC003197]